jgi:hypothetical protein
MKRSPAWMLFLLPLASVVMGIVMYYLASSHLDPEVITPVEPLSKTSYKHSGADGLR